MCKFFWKLRPFAVAFDIWHLEDPICHQSSYMSQMQKGLFWIQVASSTLKLNDLIWAKNAKSWIPSSSSWGPINVAHLKNFGILDRHALQFLNVYSSVHPSIFKSYVSQVLQKLKWIWNLFYWADLAVMALKLRHCEKATKFEKNLPLVLTFT